MANYARFFSMLLAIHVIGNCCFPHVVSAADESSIKVSPVTVRLIRECEIPASDPGILSEIAVNEGQKVVIGEPLAAMESRQQELAVEMATLSYDAAREEAANKGAVLAAEDGLRESELKLATLQLSLKAAQNVAENRSGIEIAKTDESTTLIQLNRAKSAKEQFDRSVSEAEMTRLKAQFEKAELGVAEALSKQLTNEIQVEVHEAGLAEQQSAITRHRHLLELEQWKLQQAVKATETRRVELDLAKTMLDRRSVISPISGVVTKRYHQPGEFVAAGTPILRVIQLDKLKAEGFVDVSIADQSLIGRPVRIELQGIGGAAKKFSGILTYVGQEVDPLNQQVRVWAEFSIPDLDVYPGMSAEMLIGPAGSADPASAFPEAATSKVSSETN